MQIEKEDLANILPNLFFITSCLPRYTHTTMATSKNVLLLCAALVAAAPLLAADELACPYDGAELAGGFSTIDPDSVSDLYWYVYDAIDDYLLTGNSSSGCTVDNEYTVDPVAACTQVGTPTSEGGEGGDDTGQMTRSISRLSLQTTGMAGICTVWPPQ